jgi:hypothetical protein
MFWNMLGYLCWGVVNTLQTSKPEDHPLSTACNCLFNTSEATLNTGNPPTPSAT